MVYLPSVTHPSSNRVRCRLTPLIEANEMYTVSTPRWVTMIWVSYEELFCTHFNCYVRRRRRRGQGGPVPPPPPLKIRKIYFSGNYYAKFGHFVNFSYVFFAQKMSFSLKLTELLRLWLHTRAFDSDVVQWWLMMLTIRRTDRQTERERERERERENQTGEMRRVRANQINRPTCSSSLFHESRQTIRCPACTSKYVTFGRH